MKVVHCWRTNGRLPRCNKKLSDEELKGEIERITLKDESTWNLREVTELMYICLEGGYRDGFHKGYNYGIERIELEIDEIRGI